MSERPLISGVICTHNRERFIERCIESLCVQTLDTSLYEIIVVDNGSTDKTRQLCQRFTEFPYFRYVYEPVLGLSSARNTGWQSARGKYVGYLDDDAIAESTWFEKALWSFENVVPTPDWVGGPIELEWEVPSPEWINDDCRTALGWLDWGDEPRFLKRQHERLGGGNSFYRKTILEDLGGFDTRLGRKKNLLLSGEETQFQHRLKSKGGTLFYHPGILIHHFVARERTEPSFFYKRYFWGGITDYIMSRTLENISFEHVDSGNSGESRIRRLLLNCYYSLGIFSPRGKTIQSRIYVAYVLGQLNALVKYGWRKQGFLQ